MHHGKFVYLFFIKNKFEDISLDLSFELQALGTMIKCWKKWHIIIYNFFFLTIIYKLGLYEHIIDTFFCGNEKF